MTMKTIFTERIERHLALSSKMRCPACNSRAYVIVEQLEPFTKSPWNVRCSRCGAEGLPSPLREIAIGRWKQC